MRPPPPRRMMAGIWHEGSGLGDQLMRYITVRTLAEEKGYNWGMINQQNFKGDSFMPIQKHTQGIMLDEWESLHKEWNEKATMEDGVDTRSYDPEINFVEDHTVIDGSFEDSKYWMHNLDNINEWLKVEPIYVPDDMCLIGFRGGEYASVPELFLPKEYYETAMVFMGSKRYEIHTDDHNLAAMMLPDIPVIPNKQISHSKHTKIGINWRAMREAKYAIIPNSAFYILPRLLKHRDDPSAVTIAPRYWAGRNVQQWRRPACYYPQFTFI